MNTIRNIHSYLVLLFCRILCFLFNETIMLRKQHNELLSLIRESHADNIRKLNSEETARRQRFVAVNSAAIKEFADLSITNGESYIQVSIKLKDTFVQSLKRDYDSREEHLLLLLDMIRDKFPMQQ